MPSVVVHAEVAGDGQGGLNVSWELAGDGPVEIAVGLSPGEIDRTHLVARVDGATQVSLTGLGPGRHYVSVASASGRGVVAAERLLALEGATNFRDLGGYRTAGGGRTRWGLVFRSDAPHRLTGADLAVIGRLGLRVVYDLRADSERSQAPSALPGDVRRELGHGHAAGDAARAARDDRGLPDGAGRGDPGGPRPAASSAGPATQLTSAARAQLADEVGGRIAVQAGRRGEGDPGDVVLEDPGSGLATTLAAT